MAGVLVVILVYLLVNWAYLSLLGCHGVVGIQALAVDAVAAVWPGSCVHRRDFLRDDRLGGFSAPLDATARRPSRALGYPMVPFLFVVEEIGVVVGAYCDPMVRAAAHLGAGWIATAAAWWFLQQLRPGLIARV